MDKRAWVGQLKRQVAKQGQDKASWYVFWNDPETGAQQNKSCGPGKVGKSAANKLADTIHSQLVTGTFQSHERERWESFRSRFDQHVDSMFAGHSKKAILLSMRTFERIAKPKFMKAINADLVDKFIASRLAETTTRKGPDGKHKKVSPATVNRELRYLKAAMKLAADWQFIEKAPRIRFLKTLEKRPTYVTPEHFAAIYKACSAAKMPGNIPNVSPADWWRGLIVFLYMSGWRIGQTMKLRWDSVDLEAGTAVTHAADNKGGRDEMIPLHPLTIDHLRLLAGSFDERVFPWMNHERLLWDEFTRIQESAQLPDGSPLPKCGKNGAWYGFHDLRRGFATLNAESMNLFELQALMQHQSLETTKGYVNMAKKLNRAISGLFVPSLPRIGETG